MKTKIYFIESSTSFNKNYLDSPSIAGSEKTLINITNELSKNDDLIINVFNKTDEPFKLGNLEWNNINEINKYEFPIIDCANQRTADTLSYQGLCDLIDPNYSSDDKNFIFSSLYLSS